MIKTLVAIEVDLASSMAIRYACRLGNLINLELYPVYIKAPPLEVPTVGTGWVRHTWERELVAAGKEEIREMLASEMDACPRLQEPRVLYGDREAELQRLMAQEPFDLYVEGAPYPFTPANIHRRLHARFYQHLTVPLIWLRVLKKINRVLVVCREQAGVKGLVPAIRKLWTACPTPIHLGVPGRKGGGPAEEGLRQEVAAALAELQAGGCQVEVAEIEGLGPGEEPAAVVNDYGLVAVSLERTGKKDSPSLQWLSQIKAPLLLVLR